MTVLTPAQHAALKALHNLHVRGYEIIAHGNLGSVTHASDDTLDELFDLRMIEFDDKRQGWKMSDNGLATLDAFAED